MEVFISANSPGEISGWMSPVVKKIKDIEPTAKITVLLLPCPFASGNEYKVAKSLKGVDRVFNVKETLSLIYSIKGPSFSFPRCQLHLGGDPLFAVLLSLRLKSTLWAYRWAQKQWDWRFKGYFVKDKNNRQELLKNRIAPSKIYEVGDLLVDSVRFRANSYLEKESSNKLTILLMPGSRLNEFKKLSPLFSATAEIIHEKIPLSNFKMPLSPFINKEIIENIFPLKPHNKGLGTRLTLQKNSFITEKGLKIEIVTDSAKAMAKADFVISIPGTTTGEAGALGVPLYSILPANYPEEIPYFGIVGLIGYIPLIGKPIKRKIMLMIKEKVGNVALPNILAKRKIIPESIEYITPPILFERVYPYLKNKSKRDKIKEELLSLYNPYSGAAEKIVRTILMGIH